MKKLFLTLTVLSLLQFFCFSQENVKKYYDRDDKEIKDNPSECYYYSQGKISVKGNRLDTLKSFYCKTLKPKSIEFYGEKGREGYGYYYYPNGALKEKIFYDGGFPKGIVEQYYPNGKNKETREYADPAKKKLRSPLDFLIVHAWDSLGNQMVKDYQGYFKNKNEEGRIRNGLHDSIWSTYNEYGEKFIIEKYNRGEFVEGDRYENGKTIHYSEYEVSAFPIGGIEKMYKKIGENIRYPREARKRGIQGKVFVKFTVEPNGSISNVEVVKGLEKSIDNEAVRVVKMCNFWSPGFQRGVPIRQAFTLPLTFNLR